LEDYKMSIRDKIANIIINDHDQHINAASTADAILAALPDHVRWAVDQWQHEVANRPLANVHRRTLDATWRQVIRHHGGDDVLLCGPKHDDLVAAFTGETK
jgi:hypothetical protein